MKESIRKLREFGILGNNERFFKRAKAIEKRLEKMDKLNRPKDKSIIPLSFTMGSRSGKEVLTIKNYIKKNNIKEHSHIVALLAKPTIDMTCPFLDDSKSCEKCTIYEVRPRICRDFICDPKQRPKVDLEWGLKCKPINLREEFFR